MNTTRCSSCAKILLFFCTFQSFIFSQESFDLIYLEDYRILRDENLIKPSVFSNESERLNFLNLKMTFEGNLDVVFQKFSAYDINVLTEEHNISYCEIFPGIDAELMSQRNVRKLEYFIHSSFFIHSISDTVEYLVFSEDIKMDLDWNYQLTDDGCEFRKNEFPQGLVYIYEHPQGIDARDVVTNKQDCFFEILNYGDYITLKTKISTKWLKSKQRSFPIKIEL